MRVEEEDRWLTRWMEVKLTGEGDSRTEEHPNGR